MKNPEILKRLNAIVERQLEKCVEELEREGGKLPEQDARYLDYLSHTLKSNETTLAMNGEGNSERRGRDSMGRYTSRADGGSYEGGGSGWGYYPGRAWEGGSYEGGSYRGSYEGRSMHGDKEKLRRMMEETDDERVRNALRTAMQQI